MTDPSDSSTSLRLRSVARPDRPNELVRFFSDWQTAYQHLRDHLLTSPECHGWTLVAPRYVEILDPDQSDSRWNYSKQAAESCGRTAQPLYDLCWSVTSMDLRDSETLGWHQSTGTLTVCLGTSGILAVIQDTVTTVFLPGLGSAEATRTSTQTSQRNGLPRERGMRSGRPGRTDSEQASRRHRAQTQREAAWSQSQRLYYLVFKPAVQFVKRSHHRCRDMFGRRTRTDYGLLKDKLPHLSQLKYQDWTALRAQCGRDN